jgi:nitrogen regulatory protein PII 2
MKQIIAILRDERIEETKAALEAIGLRGVTFLYVTGRGGQKGKISARELTGTLNWKMRMQLESPLSGDPLKDAPNGTADATVHPDTEFALGFLPKRMLVIVTSENDVRPVVQAIVNTNQTGRHGDGKIFICPMISAIRVRTGEQGDRALI